MKVVPTGRRMFKNLLSLSLANIITRLLGLVVVTYLARVLHASGFGKLSYAQAIISYFSLFSDMGLRAYGTREVAKNRDRIKEWVNNIVTLRIIFTILSFGILLVFLLLLPATGTREIVALYGLSLIPAAFFLDWVFRGTERMELVGIAQVVNSLVYCGLVLLFVHSSTDLLRVPLCMIAGTSVAVVFLSVLFRKGYGWLSMTVDFTFQKRILGSAFFFGLASILTKIYYNFDTVMLGAMKGDAVVGYYSAAYRVILVLISFGGLVNQAIFPAVAQYYKKGDNTKLSLLLRFTVKAMTTVAVPLAVGGTIVARPLITLLYGSQYEHSVVAFQILIWVVAVIFVSINYGNSLMACDRERVATIGLGAGAVTNIVLNAFLIPRFGLVGASAATLATEVGVFIYMVHFLGQIVRVHWQVYLLKPLIAASVMGFGLLVVDFHVLAEIPLGVVLYSVVLVLIGGVTKEDIRSFTKHVMNRSPLT